MIGEAIDCMVRSSEQKYGRRDAQKESLHGHDSVLVSIVQLYSYTLMLLREDEVHLRSSKALVACLTEIWFLLQDRLSASTTTLDR